MSKCAVSWRSVRPFVRPVSVCPPDSGASGGQPLFAGPASTQPVAWVHTHCLADYADDETRREFDDIDADLKAAEPKLD